MQNQGKIESAYHSVAVDRGRFRSRFFSYGKVDSPACRFCGCGNETLEHIVFSCPKLSGAQGKLHSVCANLNVAFNLRNLFTMPLLQRTVEECLYVIFNNEIKDNDDFFSWFAWYTTFGVLVSFYWTPLVKGKQIKTKKNIWSKKNVGKTFFVEFQLRNFISGQFWKVSNSGKNEWRISW